MARRPVAVPAPARSVHASAAHHPPVHGDATSDRSKPLLGIGNTYREERNPASMPAFRRCRKRSHLLLEQPERDPVAIAGALRDIGDWSVAFGKTGYDGTEYQRAWQLLGSAPNGEQLAARVVLGRQLRALRADQPARLEHRSRRRERARDGQLRHRHRRQHHQRDAGRIQSRRAQGRSRAAAHSPLAIPAVGRRRRSSSPAQGLAIQVKFRYLPEAASRTTMTTRARRSQPSLAALAACAALPIALDAQEPAQTAAASQRTRRLAARRPAARPRRVHRCARLQRRVGAGRSSRRRAARATRGRGMRRTSRRSG